MAANEGRHGEHIVEDRVTHNVIAVVAVVWRSQIPWAYVGNYLGEGTTKCPNVALGRRIGVMVRYQRLWAHEARCSAGRCRHFVRGCKAKVRDEHVDVSTEGRDQDVLWLQIPVVDPTGMAILKRIDDLDEHALDQLVLSEERELPDDGVKIASTEVIDEEREEARVNLTMECEHVRMG